MGLTRNRDWRIWLGAFCGALAVLQATRFERFAIDPFPQLPFSHALPGKRMLALAEISDPGWNALGLAPNVSIQPCVTSNANSAPPPLVQRNWGRRRSRCDWDASVDVGVEA